MLKIQSYFANKALSPNYSSNKSASHNKMTAISKPDRVSFCSRGEKMNKYVSNLLEQVIEIFNKSKPVKEGNNTIQRLTGRTKDGKALEFFKPTANYFLIMTRTNKKGGMYYIFDTSRQHIAANKFTQKNGQHILDLIPEDNQELAIAGTLNNEAEKYLKSIIYCNQKSLFPNSLSKKNRLF